MVLEAAPFVAGLGLLLISALEPAPNTDLGAVVGAALFFSSLGLFLLFFVSGAGWIKSGRVNLGIGILAIRGLVSLGVLAFAADDATQDIVAGVCAVLSMAMAAGSTAALAMVRERGTRRVVAS